MKHRSTGLLASSLPIAPQKAPEPFEGAAIRFGDHGCTRFHSDSVFVVETRSRSIIEHPKRILLLTISDGLPRPG